MPRQGEVSDGVWKAVIGEWYYMLQPHNFPVLVNKQGFLKHSSSTFFRPYPKTNHPICYSTAPEPLALWHDVDAAYGGFTSHYTTDIIKSDTWR